MKAMLVRLAHDESGQDLIEYSLLIGIIMLASVLAAKSIGGKVSAYFVNLDTALP